MYPSCLWPNFLTIKPWIIIKKSLHVLYCMCTHNYGFCSNLAQRCLWGHFKMYFILLFPTLHAACHCFYPSFILALYICSCLDPSIPFSQASFCFNETDVPSLIKTWLACDCNEGMSMHAQKRGRKKDYRKIIAATCGFVCAILPSSTHTVTH